MSQLKLCSQRGQTQSQGICTLSLNASAKAERSGRRWQHPRPHLTTHLSQLYVLEGGGKAGHSTQVSWPVPSDPERATLETAF